MCGRAYSTYSEEELYFRYLNKRTVPWPVDKQIPEFKPNFNFCPTQKAITLGVFEETLRFTTMRWGLVPSWANSVKDADKYSMINARAEEVSEKRSYKNAFRNRRCILPVSGFIEWKGQKGAKTPYKIQLKEEEIMSIGGIWERWESKETGEIVQSFSILTVAANSFMEGLHTRMPLIVDQDEEGLWLDPNIKSEDTLLRLLKAVDGGRLEAFEISDLINKPSNNSPEILNAIRPYSPA